MFAKPYRPKSNNTLKNTEKKQLVESIKKHFPSAPEDKIKELVPNKSATTCMKVVLHSNETVCVYAVDGVPVVIETERGLVPTVCALWRVPDLLPTLVIHSPVLAKVAGGAPLYLPGVVTGPGLPVFRAGSLVAACTQDNRAAGLVGRALMSSGDMLARDTGVCVETLHVLGDLLCKEPKFSGMERPALGPPPETCGTEPPALQLANDIGRLSIRPPAPAHDEWPALGPRAPPPAPPPHEPRVIPEPEPRAPCPPHNGTDDSVDTVADNASPEEGVPPDMEGLLRWCLLSFLRLEGKTVELPLKTSLLYRKHMVPQCPSGRSLDVKQSRYKKMSRFLEAMQQEGLLEVREVERGVDAVTATSPHHPAVRRHTPAPPPAAPAPAPAHGDPAAYTPPALREMHCVTAHVATLFPQHKKGAAMTSSEVRAALTEYVRARGLARPDQGGVALDPALARLAGRHENEVLRWDALMAAVNGKMTLATEIRLVDGTSKLIKTKLEPITMQVATRSGNKKVTLVNNLESYALSLPALAHVCQVGVGASCGVTRSPGAKADQLMLQGDQTHFVAKLLIEKYGLPKKYLEGADKALNKKK